jgi:hypothetical protein
MNEQLNAGPQDDKTSTPEDGSDNSSNKDNHLPEQSKVDKATVAAYLLANPSFLTDNPDLLLNIQVHLQENGVVSLTQIQAAQSREKIKQLKSQLDEIVSNARQNEKIYTTYAQLNLDLAKASSHDELEKALHKHLVNTLGLESVRIVLTNDQNTSEENPPLSEMQQRSIFDKKLAREPFYFGRVGNIEKEALFAKAQAESVALILLSEEEESQSSNSKPLPIGLLAISSKDPMHFKPNMDTVLVDFLRKNLNYHLSRLR